MYFFYMLRCSDNSLYSGYTTNLKRRLKEHNLLTKKGSKYTRSRQPCELVYVEEFESLKEVLKREAEVKKMSKKNKEAIVRKTID